MVADTFFQRLRREHERHGIRFPTLVVRDTIWGWQRDWSTRKGRIAVRHRVTLGLESQGLCLDEQLVEEVPVDETDQRVDIVITPSRVIRVSDARA